MPKIFITTEPYIVERHNPYKTLALVYNNLMKVVDYDQWAEYILDLTKQYHVFGGNVLELAAGSGLLANRIAQHFQSYILSDITHEMLLLQNSSLPKVCCDMALLPFKSRFDLILSAFDSVNYLLKPKFIKQLFRQISPLLSENGIFTFDVALEENSFQHEAVRRKIEPFEKGVYHQFSSYSIEKRIHTNIFTFTMNDGKKIIEIHKQRIYPFADYFRLVEGTGLYVAACYENFSFKQPSSNSKRVQFVMMKSAEHPESSG